MISQTVVDTLKSFVPEENIMLSEPMANHTTILPFESVDRRTAL